MSFFCNQKEKLFVFIIIFITSLSFAVEAKKNSTVEKKRATVSAKSWVVADENGKIIKSSNANDLRSIASITKLMTAMVVLDANQDLDEKINDISRRQHLRLALIRSNNHSNVSTSSSLVKLVLAAQNYPLIVKSSQTPSMKIKLDEGYYSFKNTNPLVKNGKFIVSKTGYIRAAGGCIALLTETNKGKRVVIVLGSQNTHTRIPEVRYLVRNY